MKNIKLILISCMLKITRTFEKKNMPFSGQLEFLEFEYISDVIIKLKMHGVYRLVPQRDQILKLPFGQGIKMAHNRLQFILNKPAWEQAT